LRFVVTESSKLQVLSHKQSPEFLAIILSETPYNLKLITYN
jgi:hypothetical protein